MRLNPDCVRDILMSIEEISTGKNHIIISSENYKAFDLLKKYEYTVIEYHINQCDMCGFFFDYSQKLNKTYWVRDLTPKAHDFLANIRDNSIWNKAKGIIIQAGSSSLNLLVSIAAEVVKEKLSGMF